MPTQSDPGKIKHLSKNQLSKIKPIQSTVMNLMTCLTKWSVFGPIDNPGAYPGKRGWKKLTLDGAAEIPSSVTIDHKKLTAKAARCLIPEPGFALELRRNGNRVEINLPPYTWGVHVKLIMAEGKL